MRNTVHAEKMMPTGRLAASTSGSEKAHDFPGGASRAVKMTKAAAMLYSSQMYLLGVEEKVLGSGNGLAARLAGGWRQRAWEKRGSGRGANVQEVGRAKEKTHPRPSIRAARKDYLNLV